MAYVIGLISAEEKEELEARGWEVEPAPSSLIDEESGTEPWEGDENFRANSHGSIWAMVWVDASMFEVMDGPDWDDAGLSKEARTFLDALPEEWSDKVLADLDEHVHETKANEAGDIVHKHPKEQLRYLIKALGLAWVKEALEGK